MKHSIINQQIRLLLLNLSTTYKFSLQTLHTAIQILMNPQLVNHASEADESMRVCMSISALFISHKVHQTQLISITQLCYVTKMVEDNVLKMQRTILRCIDYRLGCSLLIDDCLQIADRWDQFTKNLSCINVRFGVNGGKMQADAKQKVRDNMSLLTNTLQQSDDCGLCLSVYSTNDGLKLNTINLFAYNTLVQMCEKLVCNPKTNRYTKFKIGLAAVAHVIKQAQKYSQRLAYLREGKTARSQISQIDQLHIADQTTKWRQEKESCQQDRRFISSYRSAYINQKSNRTSHKSTDIIISDFILQNYNIGYHQLRQEISFIKTVNHEGLRDITNQMTGHPQLKYNQNAPKVSQSVNRKVIVKSSNPNTQRQSNNGQVKTPNLETGHTNSNFSKATKQYKQKKLEKEQKIKMLHQKTRSYIHSHVKNNR